MKLLMISILAATVALSGCATSSVVAESDHVDFTYEPILLDAGSPDPAQSGQREFRVADNGWPEVVQRQCASAQTFGGVPILIGWLSKLFVGSLSDSVDSRIAEYSSVRTTQQFAGDFYDDRFWRTYPEEKGVGGESLCFVVRQVTCPKSALSEGATSCPNDTPARLLMVGQFLMDRDVLRVRPLSLRIRGIAARYKGGTGSFAARIQARAVWQDNGVGKSQDFFDAPLLVTKFQPADSLQDVKVAVPDWKDTPILPLLPIESNPLGGQHRSRGVALITVSTAEAAEVPVSLKAFKSFLGAKGDDLSGVLKDAIENAID